LCGHITGKSTTADKCPDREIFRNARQWWSSKKNLDSAQISNLDGLDEAEIYVINHVEPIQNVMAKAKKSNLQIITKEIKRANSIIKTNSTNDIFEKISKRPIEVEEGNSSGSSGSNEPHRKKSKPDNSESSDDEDYEPVSFNRNISNAWLRF
jgi:hypothetical protein